MLITCASLPKDLHESQKFARRYIRYQFIWSYCASITFYFLFILKLGILYIPPFVLPFVSCLKLFLFIVLQYIKKLLFSDLDKSSIDRVLRQLRKLPWGECEAYLLKCFMKVHKGKYGQIHLIASLTAGLSRYHDDFAVAVVDEVCSFCDTSNVLWFIHC